MKYLALIIFVVIPSLLFAQYDEPAGSAEYFYVNTSDSSVVLNCTLLPQLGNKTIHLEILPGETVSIIEDSMFGVNPMPSDTFKSIKITLSSGQEILLENENLNSGWKTETPDRKKGESYYHTNYYLSPE